MSEELEKALGSIPHGLRRPLIEQYSEALDAARSGKWERTGLKAGKLCEIIYTILDGYISGSFAAKPSKPQNMFDACKRFEKADKTRFSRSVRLQIPRMICAVYELRNNRDIGHIGGDVEPNAMDGQFFLRSIKWLVAEVVRVFHQTDADSASKIVESITVRSNPKVWEAGDKIRVLDTSMTAKDRALVVLYHHAKPMDEGVLRDNVEYKNATDFRKNVLKKLHSEKLIEYDGNAHSVEILPPGIDRVESQLLH